MSAARRGRPTFGPLSQGPRNGPLFALVALACFAAVGAALVSQHVYGMEPCPWCVLQRLVFLAIAAFALLGLVWSGPAGTRVVGTLGLLLAAIGLAAALWQQFVAAQSASCNLTLADRIVNATGLNALLPGVFEARANCADAAVSLLGVPYALWSGALFALIATLMVVALRRARAAL
jgi:disulfide bond formation protein DsbB